MDILNLLVWVTIFSAVEYLYMQYILLCMQNILYILVGDFINKWQNRHCLNNYQFEDDRDNMIIKMSLLLNIDLKRYHGSLPFKSLICLGNIDLSTFALNCVYLM